MIVYYFIKARWVCIICYNFYQQGGIHNHIHKHTIFWEIFPSHAQEVTVPQVSQSGRKLRARAQGCDATQAIKYWGYLDHYDGSGSFQDHTQQFLVTSLETLPAKVQGTMIYWELNQVLHILKMYPNHCTIYRPQAILYLQQ